MSVIDATHRFGASKIIAFITEERDKSLSARDWEHRVAGYGYGLRLTKEGIMVTKLPAGQKIGMLPAEAV